MSNENKNEVKSQEKTNNSPQRVATGGYSERYGGGYASGSYVAPEIRGAASSVSDEMKKQAAEMGIELTQHKGYLNFGAGIQIHMPDYVVTVPTAFEWKARLNDREIIAYSRDCAQDIYSSPLVIEINRAKLIKPIDERELEQRQRGAAEMLGAEITRVSYDGRSIYVIQDNSDSAKTVCRVVMLITDGNEVFNMKLIFLKGIDNVDEITKRIYYSVHFE